MQLKLKDNEKNLILNFLSQPENLELLNSGDLKKLIAKFDNDVAYIDNCLKFIAVLLKAGMIPNCKYITEGSNDYALVELSEQQVNVGIAEAVAGGSNIMKMNIEGILKDKNYFNYTYLNEYELLDILPSQIFNRIYDGTNDSWRLTENQIKGFVTLIQSLYNEHLFKIIGEQLDHILYNRWDGFQYHNAEVEKSGSVYTIKLPFRDFSDIMLDWALSSLDIDFNKDGYVFIEYLLNNCQRFFGDITLEDYNLPLNDYTDEINKIIDNVLQNY